MITDRVTDWASIQQSLTKRFVRGDRQIVLRQRLVALKMKEGALELFVMELQRLLGQTEDLSETDAVYFFASGLSEQFRAEITYRNPSNLQEAINIAVRFASAALDRQYPQPTSTPAPVQLDSLQGSHTHTAELFYVGKGRGKGKAR